MPLLPKGQCQVNWHESVQTCRGATQPPLHSVGKFQSPTSICECGRLDQTATHVILEHKLHGAPKGNHGLLILDDETRFWFNNIPTNN